MKKVTPVSIKWLAPIVIALAMTTLGAPASAATFAPDSVNRIIASSFEDTHFDDVFGTQNSSNIQNTLVRTDTSTVVVALEGDLGALAAGQAYQIDSAVLTVGAAGDKYEAVAGAGAYRVLTAYDSTDVTWNESDADLNVAWSSPGLTADVDYVSTASATVVNATNTASWDLTSLVQQWIDGDVVNLGLYFNDRGPNNPDSAAAASNVQWTISAQIVSSVPTPAALPAGLAMLGLIASRRKRLK